MESGKDSGKHADSIVSENIHSFTVLNNVFFRIVSGSAGEVASLEWGFGENRGEFTEVTEHGDA